VSHDTLSEAMRTEDVGVPLSWAQRSGVRISGWQVASHVGEFDACNRVRCEVLVSTQPEQRREPLALVGEFPSVLGLTDHDLLGTHGRLNRLHVRACRVRHVAVESTTNGAELATGRRETGGVHSSTRVSHALA
jgi:hypothetical protein